MRGANRGKRILRANTLDECSEGVDSEQRYTKEPSAMQIYPKQHRGGKEPGYPSRQPSVLTTIPSFPSFQRNKPEQRKKPAHNVRTRVQMNRRSGHRQQHQHDRQQQTGPALQQLRKQQRENRSHQQGAQPNHSVQSASPVQNSEQYVVQPLPGKPGLTLHGGRKRIGAGKRVRRQNQLAGSDMPSDIRIRQRPIRQRPRQQRPEKKNENDVPDGRQEKTQGWRIGLRRGHQR